MFRFGGMSSVPGAPGNNLGNLVAGGIPVGQDSIFPMTQEEFSDWVKQGLDRRDMERQQNNKPGSPGPQLPPFGGRGVKGALNLPGAAGNLMGMQNPATFANSQFYAGPQMGQAPANFDAKYVS